MSETDDMEQTRTGDPVETLLRHAPVRRAPPEDVAAQVRAAVHAEWRGLTGRRARRRQLRYVALAASVVATIAVAFFALQPQTADLVRVASIEKQRGSVFVVDAQSDLMEVADSVAVSAGQRLVTGVDSAASLALAEGGSLRIAADTRVEFIAPDRIFLQSGALYVDSEPGVLAAGAAGSAANRTLVIDTPHGSVRHIGTRYMVTADAQALAVSIRDGMVNVASRYHEQSAAAGKQIRISGRNRPVVADIRVYGDAWAWTENVAPTAQLDGRSVDDFLRWVSHETGYAIEFDGAAAEDLAQSEMLKGRVDTAPMEALRIWMLGVDLDWRVESGVIHVSASDGYDG